MIVEVLDIELLKVKNLKNLNTKGEGGKEVTKGNGEGGTESSQMVTLKIKVTQSPTF